MYTRFVRSRNLAGLLALEASTAMVATGWAMRRRRLRATVNAAALLTLPAWYALQRPAR